MCVLFFIVLMYLVQTEFPTNFCIVCVRLCLRPMLYMSIARVHHLDLRYAAICLHHLHRYCHSVTFELPPLGIRDRVVISFRCICLQRGGSCAHMCGLQEASGDGPLPATRMRTKGTKDESPRQFGRSTHAAMSSHQGLLGMGP